MRSDAAKQPRTGAKESETSPRTEEEPAGRKSVGGMNAATMAATLAALTKQCGGALDPLWPPRFDSWVIPLLVWRACGIIVHPPRFCSLTQSIEQRPEVTRAALTVSLEKRTCGLLCLTFSAMSSRKHLARDVRRGHVPSGSVIPDDPVCLSEQWISVGASLVAAVMSTFSSHNCRPSTVFLQVGWKDAVREANQ